MNEVILTLDDISMPSDDEMDRGCGLNIIDEDCADGDCEILEHVPRHSRKTRLIPSTTSITYLDWGPSAIGVDELCPLDLVNQKMFKKMHMNTYFTPPDRLSYIRKVYDQAIDHKVQEMLTREWSGLIATDTGLVTMTEPESSPSSLAFDDLVNMLRETMAKYQISDEEKALARATMQAFDPYDWASLVSPDVRNVSMMATMPQYSMPQVLRAETDGIYPESITPFRDPSMAEIMEGYAEMYIKEFKNEDDVISYFGVPRFGEIQSGLPAQECTLMRVQERGSDGLTREDHMEMERQRDAWYSDPANSAAAMEEAAIDELRAKRVSKRFICKRHLGWTDEEYTANERLWQEEQLAADELADGILNTKLCKEIVLDAEVKKLEAEFDEQEARRVEAAHWKEREAVWAEMRRDENELLIDVVIRPVLPVTEIRYSKVTLKSKTPGILSSRTALDDYTTFMDDKHRRWNMFPASRNMKRSLSSR